MPLSLKISNFKLKIIVSLLLFLWLVPSVVLAVDCTRSPGGNVTISSSCTFPATVDGADAGTGTSNTAVITIGSGATLTVGASQTIATGSLDVSGTGSVAIVSGGQIKPGTPLYMYDADGDGYPKESTMAAQAVADPGFRRRNLMTSLTQRDCQDFYNSGYGCVPATNDLTNGTYSGAYQEAAGNPALSYHELPADNSTVGLWHLNEASGNVADSSGNGNTGTPTGTTVVAGKFGNGRDFDGSDDNIKRADSSTRPDAITVEAWIKMDTLKNYNSIFGWGPADAGVNGTELYVNSSGTVTFRVRSGSGTNERIRSSASNISAGQWYHIAATQTAIAATPSIYINGSLSNGTATEETPTAVSGDKYIGYGVIQQTYFDGLIDEVRVSNIARTPEEIKADAQRRPYAVYTAPVNDLGQTPGSWSGMTVKGKGVRTGDGETPHSNNSLVAQWNFNETSGTTASNAAGSCGAACNGTLTNFASTASQDQAAGTGWTANNRRWGAGALMFDGVNDHIINTAGISSLNITAPASFEAWVNTTNDSCEAVWSHGIAANPADNLQVYVGDGCTGSLTNELITVNKDAGGVGVYLLGYTTGNRKEIFDGNWHHIAVVWNGSATTIYLDGQSKTKTVGSGSDNGSFNIPSATTAYLGTRSLSSVLGTYYKGIMDSTRIYSRALSASEILANYQAGNIEFQTRTSADNSTWEDWKPVTSEAALDAVDSLSPVEKISQTSLTAYWKLDETSGSRADSKGSNTLTDNNTVTYAPGRLGNAADFEADNIERLSITDNADTSTGDIDFTWSAWVNLESTGNRYIVGKGGATDEYLLRYQNATSRFEFFVVSATATANSLGTPSLNTWYYIVGWHDATANTVNIQVNNGPVDSTSYAGGGSDTNNGLAIGDSAAAGGSPWDGLIDEVAFWKRTLTAAERTRLFEDGLDLHGAGSGRVYRTRDTTTKIEGTGSEKFTLGAPQVDASTVGLWHMEETSGTGAYIKDQTPISFNPDTNSTLTNNTVAYWRLNETSGTRYDSVGSNDLTDNNTVTSNPGKQGNAGQFVKANAEYLSIANNSDLQVGNIDFTLSGWFYLDSLASTDNKYGLTKEDEYEFLYRPSSSDFRFYIANFSKFVSSGTAATAGTWYFVVMWHDAAADTINLQINNGTINSSATAGVYPSGTASFQIGNYGAGPDFAWDGRIDEVGFWKRVLTAQERTDLYNAGSGQSISGHNHGTPTGTTVVDGFYGKGRNFNGTSDYVEVNPSSSLPTGSNPVTVEAWFKASSISGSRKIIAGYGDTAETTFGHFFISIDTAGKMWIRLNGADPVSSTTTVSLNTWYYLVGLDDGTNFKIYVNGVQEGSVARSQSKTSGRIRIGRYVATDPDYFAGTIDEVRISNVARTAEEIAEAFRAGRDHRLTKTITSTDLSAKTKLPFYVASDRPGTFMEATVGESAYANYEPDANTVGLWHLEEAAGSGAYIKDSSSNGNNGTPTGTTFVQGKLGKARSFNGTSDYIALGTSKLGSLVNGASTVTSEAWIYPLAFPGSGNTARIVNAVMNGTCTTGFNIVLGSTGLFKAAGRSTTSDAQQILSMTAPTGFLNNWHHLVAIYDYPSKLISMYYDGGLYSSTSVTWASNTYVQGTPSVTDNIGVGCIGVAGEAYFNGTIDEVRISNTARTADEIRQAYEVGKRTHPITIDFVSSPQAAYTSGTSVTINNPWGTTNLTDTLSVGDTMIFKENVGGTETVSQAAVTAITNTSSVYGTVTLDAAPTFPTGGYSTNAKVFKWQREMFDLTGSLPTHRDGSTRLTLRVTDGSQGANVWLDDFKSASYINRTTCDTLNTTTGECTYSIPGASVTSSYNRYAQIRAIMSTWDTAVSPIFTSSQIEFGL